MQTKIIINKINRIYNRIMNKKENNQEMNTENSENIEATPINESEVQEEKLQEETTNDSLQETIDELNDRYLRLYSEFDNYKKGQEKRELI